MLNRIVPLALLLLRLACGQSVSYTYDQTGLLTLAYNSHNWLWYSAGNTITNPQFSTDGATCTLDSGPTLSTATTGTNFTQHVYNSGGSHQFTVRWDWSSPASDTFTAQVTITNQSSGDSMCGGALATPSLILTSDVTGSSLGVVQNTDSQPFLYTTLSGGGSVAVWRGEVNAKTNIPSFRNSDTPLLLDTGLQWGYSEGPNTFKDFLPSGNSIVFSEYYRFSTSAPGATTLAAGAIALWNAAYPSLVTWADRRPIASMFMANNPAGNNAFYPNNPRGWFNDATFNALDATTFHTRMTSFFAGAVSVMDALAPKPQGVILWDLEGQEFGQPFSYVGNPPALPSITPEMDSIADEMIGLLKTAGYRVGFTLRPQTFSYGNALPATCVTNAAADRQQHFILLSATPPNRGYRCTSTNTWTQTAIGEQYDQFDVSAVVADLQSKIDYAVNRWGASLFYVDSNGWYDGSAMTFKIFRTLAAANRNVLIIPEIAPFVTYFGSGSQWGTMDLGIFRTPDSQRALYPDAFRLLQIGDASQVSNAAEIQIGMARGDIYLFPGWYSAPNNGPMYTNYSSAQTANSTLQMTDSATSSLHTFTGTPSTINGLYPVTMRVYFASTSGGLTTSTTYCKQVGGVTCYASGVQQTTATLNLSGMSYYQVKYYDFAGGFVAQGAATPLSTGRRKGKLAGNVRIAGGGRIN